MGRSAAEALVWVGGRLLAESRAQISVQDHGFLYGDSIYETLRTEGGRPLFLDAHLRRLERSAKLLGMDVPAEIRNVSALVSRARRRLRAEDVVLRIMVTRGRGPLTPDPTRAGPPALLVFIRPFVPRPAFHYSRGVKAAIASFRRVSSASIPTQAKTGNFLPHVLAIAEARARGCDEALMLSPSGRLAEGAISNLFWWENDVLFTPALSTGILPGITRQEVLQLARKAGYRIRQVRVRPSRLFRADEAFLTNSTGGVVPLTAVDGRRLGSGRPGPRTRDLAERYAAHLVHAS